jgi:hypothetical protein
MKYFNIRFNATVVITLLIGVILTLPVKAQTRPDGSAPQFLYPEFTKSKVRMKNGQVQNIMLNYNTVSEKMVFQRDEKLYDMANPEMVDTVFLQDSRFVPSGKVFYKIVLVAPVAFYAQYKGEVQSPGTPAGYGGTSQVSNTKNMSSVQLSTGYYNLDLPADYTVKTSIIYWFSKDGKMLSFVTERQFLKLNPDKETEIKQFIKQNRIKFDKLPDMVKLGEYYNQLIQQVAK